MTHKKRFLALILAGSIALSGCSSNENSGAVGEESSSAANQSESSYSDGNGSSFSSEGSSSGDSASQNVSDGTGSSSADGNASGSGSSGSENAGGSGSSGTSDSPRPTGNGLTSVGNASEGTVSTGKFNYGEALQKSILFYELQRSGDIDEKTARCNWRGDSGMNDGADVGLDLTGGLYDAGDNVKFNLPMTYTSTVLAWSIYEDKNAYVKSGQLDYALGNVKWICDYLIKCHPQQDVFYYQVGDGNADHSWWGPAEVMQMNRPSFKVDKNSPGSTVAGEAAAAVASCAVIYKDIDKSYSEKCLTHAKQLYNFAETTKSDAGYTAANGFYSSFSGFTDELIWGAVWLYIATGDESYLRKADGYFDSFTPDYKWAFGWDNKFYGAACLLANLTNGDKYKKALEKNLDWWCGIGGESITYTPKGLAWLDSWGSLRYAMNTAFIAGSYVDGGNCPAAKKAAYTKLLETQTDYALGSTGRSFVVGYGVNPPEHPHHRTAQGSWANNMSEPNYHRHILYGALVGGPDASDGYTDMVSDYCKNEVACDYNAGFTGALAKMYGKYGGQTLKNFGAVEKIQEELYTEYKINASGSGFTEIKAVVYNKTGWPARVTDNLELRYFVDLSEIADPASVQVSLNYNDGAKFNGIYEWNKAKNIYYVSIDFSGVKIYPGGQSEYKKEVQFRMSANGWNAENDPSYKELKGSNGSELVRAVSMGLYEGKTLVFGSEPDGKLVNTKPVTGGSSVTQSSQSTPSSQSSQNTQPSNPTQTSGGIRVSLSQQQTSGNANTIPLSIEIVNNTGSSIELSGLEIDYFFTNDGDSDLVFWCDYAAISGGTYSAVTGSVSGGFSSASGNNCDTKCAVKFSSGAIQNGDSVTVQGRITRKNWSEFNLSNDYSSGDAGKLYITSGGKAIFGSKP